MSRAQAPSSGRKVSRRHLLVGAGVVVAAAGAGVASRTFEGHGEDGVVPDSRPGRLLNGSFVSAARRGQTCGWTLAWPPGGRTDLPVAVVLHGRGNDHASVFSRGYLALDRFLASVVASGTAPFALASVDGGETYWHARDDGDDAGAMVIDELLPLLAGHGLETSRIGLLGWSMGGFGALHLARTLGPDRVVAVGALSPALWHDYADTAPGAYDDAEDFAEVDVMGRQDSLTGIPVRIDCGRSDPFVDATRDFVRGFEVRPAGGFQPGEHNLGYWRRMAPAQLEFLGSALSGDPDTVAA